MRQCGCARRRCLDCGFADQSHFSRRFKGALGVTPAQWVRQMGRSGSP
ncbi:MAG TPA: AraC family transcriptional regulator [Ramlibacter sp.]|nr:AraC family transcriptional regulator [Ramlibacter sp.]